jgi:hypothetical protein
MDPTSFTFPSLRAANPPPSLLEVIAEIIPQDSLPDPIRIHCPLHLNNIPDTDAARVAVHSLNRVRETLCSPFNTPDAVLPRRLWLQMVLELLAIIHEGLRNAQLACPLAANDIGESTAFDDTDGDKVAIMSRCHEILGWLRDFFLESDTSYAKATRLHCSRCIQSGYCLQHKDAESLSRSLQLTNAIDARAFRESLLNKVIPSIHRDVDEWRVRQCQLLIDQITSIITDDELSGEALAAGTHALNPDLQKWVDLQRDAITSFARSRITNEACENTISLWASEVVIHRIDEKRRELDAITDASPSAADIEHCKQNRLVELQVAADDEIKAEEARLREIVAQRLGALHHDTKVKIFDGENEASSRSLSSAICTAKGPKPSPISSRTRSKGKHTKKRVLDLHSQTSEDSDHPMTADEPEDPIPPSPVTVANSLSPAELTPKATTFFRPETPPPLSRPSSLTPTGPPKLTPSVEPASELTMVLAALDGLKSSLLAEIQKVNSRVDQLILNPPDLVPSSQPFDDFGDFALPTTEDDMEAATLASYAEAECHRRCSESLDCSDCCVKSSTIELKSQEVFLRPYTDAWKTVSATGSREGNSGLVE